ncbi:hypothetical protein ACEPAG_3647 [Sanghuangporus baumii]
MTYNRAHVLRRRCRDRKTGRVERSRDHVWRFLYYVKTDVAELWETTDQIKDQNPNLQTVKREIIALYSSLTAGKRYSKGELEHLVVEWAKKGIKNREDLGEYHREFVRRSKYLITNGKILESQADEMFLMGITRDLREVLIHRIEIKLPDHASSRTSCLNQGVSRPLGGVQVML